MVFTAARYIMRPQALSRLSNGHTATCHRCDFSLNAGKTVVLKPVNGTTKQYHQA